MVVERYSYDVFGEPNKVSDVNNPYMFTGRRFDTETGLYYFRARYYAYDIGRFLQTDPIGYVVGLNLYTYCGNNPVICIDPYGLTKTFGLGGSPSGLYGFLGGTGGVQLVLDTNGNIGSYSHAGLGVTGGAAVTETIDFSVTQGEIFDLTTDLDRGPTTSSGATVQVFPGFGFGLETNTTDRSITDPGGSGFTFSFGGMQGLPLEVHSYKEIGSVYELGNIKDLSRDVVEHVGEYWKDKTKSIWDKLKDIFKK